MHRPIFLKDISLSYANQSCFEDFSSAIYAGSRIAIIGRNGSGKSSLLNILRKSLMQMLKRYQGTLIVVSHDTELLRNCIDTLWHIDNKRIHEFTGSYDDYMREIKHKRASIERELASLKRDKKETHNALMKEQKRAAGSKAKG